MSFNTKEISKSKKGEYREYGQYVASYYGAKVSRLVLDQYLALRGQIELSKDDNK